MFLRSMYAVSFILSVRVPREAGNTPVSIYLCGILSCLLDSGMITKQLYPLGISMLVSEDAWALYDMPGYCQWLYRCRPFHHCSDRNGFWHNRMMRLCPQGRLCFSVRTSSADNGAGRLLAMQSLPEVNPASCRTGCVKGASLFYRFVPVPSLCYGA